MVKENPRHLMRVLYNEVLHGDVEKLSRLLASNCNFITEAITEFPIAVTRSYIQLFGNIVNRLIHTEFAQ